MGCYPVFALDIAFSRFAKALQRLGWKYRAGALWSVIDLQASFNLGVVGSSPTGLTKSRFIILDGARQFRVSEMVSVILQTGNCHPNHASRPFVEVSG
jgi:hypothetical protein